jgi:hypothetical protein
MIVMKNEFGSEIVLGEHGLSFFAADANMGVKNFGLRLAVEGQTVVVQYAGVTEAGNSIAGRGVAGELKISSSVEVLSNLNAVVLRHSISNRSGRPIEISTVATGQFAASSAVLPGKGNWLGWDLRYCHTDNVRTEHYPHCQMEYPYVRMLPAETVRLGQGEDQPFPALYIRDELGKHGVVFAAATQALNFTTFEMRKRGMVNEGVFERFLIHHDPGQASAITVPAGGSVDLDGIFIQITGDLRAEDVYVDYIDFLSSRITFRGPTTAILSEAFHCTWNYGPFADQTEKSLLPTARFIAANFPKLKWFLMDAGYLGGDSNTFLHRFYPDPNQFVTTDKWPRGIRGFTDELRRMGLRPGLWWSPTTNLKSALCDDHPDWVLRKADGSPYLIDKNNAYLDYSHPEALDYLDRTLAVILGQWGMDACKMDFWSQNFEDRHARLRDPGVTAVQARARLFQTIRKHLPADGILMTCVATGMGNPLIGQWADTYRNTMDIGVGAWHEQINNCIWALPTLSIEGRKTFLLNNDSAGIMAEYPDNENLFRLTWSYINMGLLETGGRMETWPQKWVQAMRKLTDRCDRGHRVHCPDDRAFTGVPLPEVLYVDFPPDSPTAKTGVKQSVALFNWTDEPKVISVRRARLGHTAPVRSANFWTGELENLDGEFLTATLDKRSALLLDILQ